MHLFLSYHLLADRLVHKYTSTQVPYTDHTIRQTFYFFPPRLPFFLFNSYLEDFLSFEGHWKRGGYAIFYNFSLEEEGETKNLNISPSPSYSYSHDFHDDVTSQRAQLALQRVPRKKSPMFVMGQHWSKCSHPLALHSNLKVALMANNMTMKIPFFFLSPPFIFIFYTLTKHTT